MSEELIKNATFAAQKVSVAEAARAFVRSVLTIYSRMPCCAVPFIGLLDTSRRFQLRERDEQLADAHARVRDLEERLRTAQEAAARDRSAADKLDSGRADELRRARAAARQAGDQARAGEARALELEAGAAALRREAEEARGAAAALAARLAERDAEVARLREEVAERLATVLSLSGVRSFLADPHGGAWNPSRPPGAGRAPRASSWRLYRRPRHPSLPPASGPVSPSRAGRQYLSAMSTRPAQTPTHPPPPGGGPSCLAGGGGGAR